MVKVKSILQEHKKAELSSAWLITIILLALSFVILLIFLYNVKWNQNADLEVCHQSVIIRATVPNIIENHVPLKCRTQKICITTGLIAGECENLKGEKGIMTIKVSSGETGVVEINKILAQNILSCWSMMGEGKLSLFQQTLAKQFGIGDVYPTCVICNRIAFDTEKLEKAGIDLSKVDVTAYMSTHLVPNTGKTYFQTLAGGDGKYTIADNLLKPITSDSQLSCKSTSSTDESDKRPFCLTDYQKQQYDSSLTAKQVQASRQFNFSNSKDTLAILFMQISAPDNMNVLTNTLSAVGLSVLGSTILAPQTTLKSLGSLVKVTKVPVTYNLPARVRGGASFSASSGVSGYKTAGVGLSRTGVIAGAVAVIGLTAQQLNVEYQKSVTAEKCSDVQMGHQQYEGCSVVRAIPYNEEDIKTYCSVIESIP